MLKIIKIFLYFIFLINHSAAQQAALMKKWDRRYGGEQFEGVSSLRVSPDGGYIIGVVSNSGSDGDKTESNWDSSLSTQDYWIVKVDSLGNKQWDKRYGGTGEDGLFDLKSTYDQGYIMGGYSSSGINGDKTQFGWGGNDFWVVKIDLFGNKQWDKRFGGTLTDDLHTLQQTKDLGYILGGTSNSGIGGDKSQNNWDSTHFHNDGWIVKIDSLGNKQWDKRYGGTNYEDIVAVLQISDGGYMIGCYSASGMTGDKTQPALGGGDFWIVKIDSLGNKEWDKSYGDSGTDNLTSIQQTADKGFILGGNYFLMIKIDSAGNVQWEKAYSGNAELSSLVITSDNGYLLSGTSHHYLIQPRDKTEPNLGTQQAWIVKTDSLGNKQWDKTIFSRGHDWCAGAVEVGESCYTIAIQTDADTGGYKTQFNWGGYDLWLVKLCWEIPSIASSLDTESGISVYPNPFTSDIAISLQKENLKEATFTISNMLGQVVFRKEENNLSSSYTKMLDLSYLPKGAYLVEVVIDGEQTIKKVVRALESR